VDGDLKGFIPWRVLCTSLGRRSTLAWLLGILGCCDCRAGSLAGLHELETPPKKRQQ